MTEWVRGASNAGALVFTTVDALLRHTLGERLRREPEGAAARGAVAMQRWARRVAEQHRLELRVRGVAPAAGEGVLIVANHLSYLDVVALAATAPAIFLGMLEVASWPLLGRAAGVAGMVFVERGDGMSGAGALRRIGRLLRASVNVVTFPEGRTSAGDVVRPFSPALFRLALAARRPIVPVAIRYDDPTLAWTGDASFLPHYAQVARRAASAAELFFLPRLGEAQGAAQPTTATARASGAEIAAEARAAIAAAIGARLEESQ